MEVELAPCVREAARRTTPLMRWFDGRVDAQTNVDHDEALLEAARPAARVGLLIDVSVSLGIGQHPSDRPATRAGRLAIPVVRRRSGGSGLLHMDGDLAWSIVLPRTDPLFPRDYVNAYGRLGAGAVEFLADLGIEAEWSAPFGFSDSFCLLGPRGRVLTVDGHAIGGAAQHVTRGALLHQGMISYQLDRHLLDRLFDIDDRIAGRYLASLRDLGIAEPPHLLGSRLLDSLGESLDVERLG